MPRPLLPGGHGPRRGSHEEPGPRGGSARVRQEGDSRARLGRGGFLHRIRREGARFDRGDARGRRRYVPPSSRDSLEAPRGEDEAPRASGGSGVRGLGRSRMRLRAWGRRVTALADMVRALREVTKAEAIAVVNRDGGIVAAELPRNVSEEEITSM